MAGNAVTTDPGLFPIFKEWYDDKKMAEVLWAASPVLRDMQMTRIGGKTYNFTANYAAGGASSGSALVAQTNAANGQGKNVQFAVTPGRLYSIFNVNPQEIFASENVRGAFVPVPVIRMGDGLASLRRLWAIALYGTGFGEIGQVGATPTTSIGSQTLDLADYSIITKLDLGVTFQVTNGATPGSTLRAGLGTVTHIDGTVVTFTYTAVETWAATDWICIEGCRDGANGVLPVGIPAWLPGKGQRSALNNTFYGVDRSLWTDRLAGNYLERKAGEKISDFWVRCVQRARMAGQSNSMILITNPFDYNDFITEMSLATALVQQTNMSAAKGSSNAVTRGLAESNFMFQNSWLEKVYADTYCPKNTFYIVDKDSLEFIMLNGGDQVVKDGIASNDPGVQNPADASAPDLKTFQFIFDDYMTFQPGAMTAAGPVLSAILQIYGNFIVRQPGHCVVGYLVAPST